MPELLPHGENLEALMALVGDTLECAARRSGIEEERLSAHFETGAVLTAPEIAAFRRAYTRFGARSFCVPGFRAVIQFTTVVEIRTQLHLWEVWPEPWPDDSWLDRQLGRAWRWWVRHRAGAAPRRQTRGHSGARQGD